MLTASAAAVLSSQKSAESDDVRTAAVKSNPSPPPVRESQVRQPPAASAPQRVETIKYGAWVVVCEDSVGGATKRTCNASLTAVSQGQNPQQLLNWQIGVNKDGHYITAFHVPPAIAVKKEDRMVGGPILVQSGLELKFGTGPARRISYVWCGPRQCVAEALIDDAFVKEALANTKATITVHTFGGEPIPIDIPITGMDKAISSTRK
jgi:invasion protein IalB